MWGSEWSFRATDMNVFIGLRLVKSGRVTVGDQRGHKDVSRRFDERSEGGKGERQKRVVPSVSLGQFCRDQRSRRGQ